MNKKKLFALILSVSITSNLLLSTTNVYADEINTNNALSELSLEKNSYTEEAPSDLSSKEKSNLIVSTNETNTISTLATDEIVEIPDANLKLVLNEIIGQDPTNDITKSHLAQIREIDAQEKNISNLEGLQYCTNLIILNLSDNQISDITPLSNLTTLRSLVLWNNQISDISALSKLVNLDNLTLSLNPINDFSHLSNLTNLEILNLYKTKIKDLTPLTNLTNLTHLNLDDNQISDITPLANLTKLRILDSDYNKISNLSPLSKLNNLVQLSLEHNEINDLSHISKLNNLISLWVENNQISDLSPLSQLSKLEYLDIQNNQINDLVHLSNLSNLDILDLEDNQISDLSPLHNLSNLKSLYISNNKISNLSPLSNLNNLETLYAHNNQIGDLSPLQNLTNLSDLRAQNQIIELEKINLNSTSLEIENKIKNLNGEIVDNIHMINYGAYNPKTNLVKWENINSTDILKYEFSESINNGSDTNIFSGTVNQPIEQSINTEPVIIAEDKTLTVGDKFNPLEGVSAFDEEDGEIKLTEDNIISNDVDMSQAGTYSITYKVTDSQGASALKTITVVVNPKLEVVNPENNTPTVESKPEVDNKPTDTTIENTTNKLPNTGIESSLPLLGALSLTIGTALSLKKKQK